MRKIILSVLLFIFIPISFSFSQPNVKPSPLDIGLTYEQIINKYPTYWTVYFWNWPYNRIAYYNIAIPGRADYYFDNRLVCSSIIIATSDTDSVKIWNNFILYCNYIKNELGAYCDTTIDRSSYPFFIKRWSNSDGEGAVVFSSDNIYYKNANTTDGKYYYYSYITINNFGKKVINYPKNKPKVKLE